MKPAITEACIISPNNTQLPSPAFRHMAYLKSYIQTNVLQFILTCCGSSRSASVLSTGREGGVAVGGGRGRVGVGEPLHEVVRLLQTQHGLRWRLLLLRPLLLHALRHLLQYITYIHYGA